jgi:hypothetical protein
MYASCLFSSTTVALEQSDFFLTQLSMKVMLLESLERCALLLLNATTSPTASHDSKYALVMDFILQCFPTIT